MRKIKKEKLKRVGEKCYIKMELKNLKWEKEKDKYNKKN
jgi:hypothetical protein